MVRSAAAEAGEAPRAPARKPTEMGPTAYSSVRASLPKVGFHASRKVGRYVECADPTLVFAFGGDGGAVSLIRRDGVARLG